MPKRTNAQRDVFLALFTALIVERIAFIEIRPLLFPCFALLPAPISLDEGAFISPPEGDLQRCWPRVRVERARYPTETHVYLREAYVSCADIKTCRDNPQCSGRFHANCVTAQSCPPYLSQVVASARSGNVGDVLWLNFFLDLSYFIKEMFRSTVFYKNANIKTRIIE